MINKRLFLAILLGLTCAGKPANAALVPADKAELGTPVNYISNGGCERGTAGWKVYADAAAASPVDGTGGSPSVTIAAPTSNPLEGKASCLFTKGASNLQGQGWSYDFTIGRAQLGKVQQVSFDYEVASGTYTDDGATDPDLTVWIYDVTNSQLLGQLTPYRVLGGTVNTQMRFQGRFQTSASGVAYRLILHESRSGASAYTVKADSFYIGPQLKNYGPAVTDAVTYSPTISNFGTISSSSATQARRGDKLRVDFIFAMGTGAASTAKLSLPSGLSIDFTKLNVGVNQVVGKWNGDQTKFSGAITVVNTDTTNVEFSPDTTAFTFPLNGNSWAAGSTITGWFEVPVVGWSSSVAVSSDGETRVISAVLSSSSNQSLSNGTDTKILFDTARSDKIAGFDSTNHNYIIRVPGTYQVKGTVQWVTNGTGIRIARIYKNSSTLLTDNGATPTSSNQMATPTSYTGDFVAGDTLELHGYQDSGGTLSAVGTTGGIEYTKLEITRLSGAQQIAASDPVYASYEGASGTIGTGQIDFPSKVLDNFGAVTGAGTGNSGSWRFTAPSHGIYSVNLIIQSTVTNSVDLYKNGSFYRHFFSTNASGSTGSGTVLVELNAGDYIYTRRDTGSSSAAYGSLDIIKTAL